MQQAPDDEFKRFMLYICSFWVRHYIVTFIVLVRVGFYVNVENYVMTQDQLWLFLAGLSISYINLTPWIGVGFIEALSLDSKSYEDFTRLIYMVFGFCLCIASLF